jgi:hypothetical protein
MAKVLHEPCITSQLNLTDYVSYSQLCVASFSAKGKSVASTKGKSVASVKGRVSVGDLRLRVFDDVFMPSSKGKSATSSNGKSVVPSKGSSVAPASVDSDDDFILSSKGKSAASSKGRHAP